MSLEETITEHWDASERVRKGLTSLFKTLTPGLDCAIHEARNTMTRNTINEHLKKYPHHRDIALGNAPTLKERAARYIREEFKADTENKAYLWRAKKVLKRMQESEVTREISSVRALDIIAFAESLESRGKNRYFLRASPGIIGGIMLGLATSSLLELSNSGSIAVSSGLIAAGYGITVFASPLRIDFTAYLDAAATADSVLREIVRPYLP